MADMEVNCNLNNTKSVLNPKLQNLLSFRTNVALELELIILYLLLIQGYGGHHHHGKFLKHTPMLCQ